MATVKQALIENDVVMLRERVGKWPAGTIGTAVSVHEDSALVEVSDSTTGEGLDMFEVPAALLEIQPRTWLKS
jgi:hypothetical protein